MIETKELFAKSDLIPVIIQDRATKEILMLGYTCLLYTSDAADE